MVVQLGGGNDGLNTVVPYGSNSYFNLRPGLAIGEPGHLNRMAKAMSAALKDADAQYPSAKKNPAEKLRIVIPKAAP